MSGDIRYRAGDVGVSCLAAASLSLISIAPVSAGVVVWRPVKKTAGRAVALLIYGQGR